MSRMPRSSYAVSSTRQHAPAAPLPSPAPANSHPLFQLQTTLGNRAVQRLLVGSAARGRLLQRMPKGKRQKAGVGGTQAQASQVNEALDAVGEAYHLALQWLGALFGLPEDLMEDIETRDDLAAVERTALYNLREHPDIVRVQQPSGAGRTQAQQLAGQPGRESAYLETTAAAFGLGGYAAQTDLGYDSDAEDTITEARPEGEPGKPYTTTATTEVLADVPTTAATLAHEATHVGQLARGGPSRWQERKAAREVMGNLAELTNMPITHAGVGAEERREHYFKVMADVTEYYEQLRPRFRRLLFKGRYDEIGPDTAMDPDEAEARYQPAFTMIERMLRVLNGLDAADPRVAALKQRVTDLEGEVTLMLAMEQAEMREFGEESDSDGDGGGEVIEEHLELIEETSN